MESKPIRVGGYTVSAKSDGYGNRIEFQNLTKEEMETIQRNFGAGGGWLRIQDGRLEERANYNDLPKPTDDPYMAGFWGGEWRKPMEIPTGPFPPKIYEFEEIREFCFPSIMIQSVCGYDWTPQNYASNVERLESFGFCCMRSRRSREGKYWEAWFLPSLSAAQGRLKMILEDHKVCSGCGSVNYFKYRREEENISCMDCHTAWGHEVMVKAPKTVKEQIEAAVNFLCRNTSFGTLDISVQRAAMVLD